MSLADIFPKTVTRGHEGPGNETLGQSEKVRRKKETGVKQYWAKQQRIREREQ